MARPTDSGPAETTASLGAAASAVPLTFTPGELVAERYQVVRFLAEGGMGEVYEAIDRALHERVALKTVRPDIAGDEGVRDRFRREIQLARRVTHANVCRIFDLGFHGEVMFLTMELLPGRSLADRLQRDGRMPLDEALPILEQVAAGLDAAHRAGIVHGDLKPSNVMLTSNRAVITDFGLARGRAAHDAGSSPSPGIVGSPAYMAPEQVRDGEIGAATDIYALGVVMYRMATGELPFLGDTPLSTAAKRLSEPPRPARELAPDLDPRWEATIARCLQREAAARFSNVLEVIRALHGERPRPRRRWSAVALAAAVLAVVLLYPRAPSVKARRSVAVLGFRNLSGRADDAWMSGALTEMLTTELGAGDKLRAIPGEAVTRVKTDLELADEQSFSPKTLRLLNSRLGADVVVAGWYLSAGGRVRIELRLQDTASGETIATAADSGGEADLVDMVSRAGGALRARLGMAALTDAESRAARASMPSSPQAARLYAEGLAKLRSYDGLAAIDLLEQAARVEPGYPLAHAALADAWWFLGFEPEARAEARQALDLSQSLSPPEKMLVEARYWETAGEPAKAGEIYDRLFHEQPDDVELAFALLRVARRRGDFGAARAAIAVVRRFPRTAEDPRLDVALRDMAVNQGDLPGALAASERLVEKGKALGALPLVLQGRNTQGWARWLLGDLDGAERAYRSAADIAARVGDRNALAGAMWLRGMVLADHGYLEEAQRAFAAIDAPPNDTRGSFSNKLDGLGLVALKRGELTEAETRFKASLEACRGCEARKALIAHVTAQLGRVAYERGDLAQSRALLEQALLVDREIDNLSEVAYALGWLGATAAAQADLAGARRHLEEALRIWEQRGAAVEAARCRVALARVALGEGRAQLATGEVLGALAALAPLPDDRAAAEAVLGLALAAGGRSDAARAVADGAAAAAASSEDLPLRLEVEMARARVRGDGAAAEAVRAEAAKAGLVTRVKVAP